MNIEKEIEEIKQTITELIKRCRELDVNLAVSFSSKKTNLIGSSIVGDPVEIFLLLQRLKESLKEESKMTTADFARAILSKEKSCQCPTCQAERAERKESDELPASLDEIKSMLINILGGME